MTYRQYFEKLPEPYKTQCLENCKRLDDDIDMLRSRNHTGIICSAFSWIDTPEESNPEEYYWAKFSLSKDFNHLLTEEKA